VAIDLCQRQLVKELCQIYPIISKNQDRFWIANAELPLDLFRGLVHEDEISAALGFIAHSLSLLSKYLHVVLRHRIICNSSRSGIRDADGSLLPLFLSRSSERSQIERGMILLHRNISCLAQSRGIVLSESHILAKLNQVYEIVLAK
jgi:Vacuolar sorting 38 and autophagy-related subunit 14